MSPSLSESPPTAEVARRGTSLHRPPSVCHVVATFHPVVGGVQSVTEELCARLVEAGQDVTVLTRAVPGAPPEETHRGIRIVRVGRAETGPLASMTFMLGALWALATRLRHCSIVHVQNIDAPLLVGFLGRLLLGRTLIATIHGELLVINMNATWLGRLRVRLMARWVDRFTALSPRMEEQLLREGVPPSRIDSIPNGVDPARIVPKDTGGDPLPVASLGVPEGHCVALFVGRLDPVKLIDVILRAWGRRTSPVPATLLIVGEGPERPALEALIAQEELANVILAGEQRDVLPYLAVGDFLLLTSRQEGLSIALLEAGAAGLPAIVSDLPGNRAVIEDEWNGVIVPVGDPGALATAIDRMLDDPEARSTMGSAARRRVEERFSIDTAVGRHLEMYGSLP